jgi:hypothetical protein
MGFNPGWILMIDELSLDFTFQFSIGLTIKNHYQCFKSYSRVLNWDKKGSLKVIVQFNKSVLILLLFKIGLIWSTKHPLQSGFILDQEVHKQMGFNPGWILMIDELSMNFTFQFSMGIQLVRKSI